MLLGKARDVAAATAAAVEFSRGTSFHEQRVRRVAQELESGGWAIVRRVACGRALGGRVGRPEGSDRVPSGLSYNASERRAFALAELNRRRQTVHPIL